MAAGTNSVSSPSIAARVSNAWAQRSPGTYFHVRNVLRRATGTSRRQKRLFSGIVGPGSLVFDIGANIGEYSRAFYSLGAVVLAVEPQPQLAAYLERRFAGVADITVLEAAVSTSPGIADLYLASVDALASFDPSFHGDEQTEHAGFSWARSITVSTTTLDALVDEYGQPDLVKVDVEGHEERVLQGLRKSRPPIFFEVSRARGLPVLDLLDARGYRRYRIRPGESGRWADQGWLDAETVRRRLQGTTGACDVLAFL